MIKLKKHKKTEQWLPGRDLRTPGAFHALEGLLPLLLAALVAVFILYPVVCLVRATLIVDGAFSLARYDGLLRANRGLLWDSVFSAALAALLATALAVCIALRIAMSGARLRTALMTIVLITMVSPPFVGSLAYIQLYGRRGWITHSLLGLSLNPYNWRGVVLMQGLSFASMGAIFLVGMLDKADRSLLHAARDLGATPAQALRDVLLPLMRPGIAATLLLSFIRALADFGTPIVIGGRFNTVASEIYMQITGYANLSQAATLNMLILIPSVAAFLVYRRLIQRSDRLLSRAGSGQTANEPLAVRGGTAALVNLCAGVFFLMMVLQYICIFASGFVKGVRGTYHFTLEHWNRVMTYDMSSMVRSIVYALIVGVVGTLFSMLLAYYIERRKIPGHTALDFFVTLPYMIPGTCFGISYILAFGQQPLKLTGTAAIVVLNMLFRQVPNAGKIISASLSQIPYSLEDAARDLGARRWQVMTGIILPNLKNAFFSGFVYNFTSAMTTAGAILFLIQPGQKIAVFRLFDAINTGEYGVASLLASMMILISLAVNLSLMGLTGERKGGARLVSTAEQAL